MKKLLLSIMICASFASGANAFYVHNCNDSNSALTTLQFLHFKLHSAITKCNIMSSAEDCNKVYALQVQHERCIKAMEANGIEVPVEYRY